MFTSRRNTLLALTGGLIHSSTASPQDAAAINKDLDSRRTPLSHTLHPQAQWFPDAGLGLFIHWGLASVHGSIDLSWGMMHGMGSGTKITPEEYFRLAERFNPDQWDPDRMLAAARKAGFRYAVLTAKHHEGFALWPSAYGEFNTKKYAGGRDLVRPFIEACRKNGLKAGLYYSPGDWYFSRRYMSFNYRSAHCWQTTGLTCKPELPDYDTRFQPVTLPERTPAFESAYRDYKRGQIRELLTRYGALDILWFDMATADIMTTDEIRALQPAIVINDRMGGNTGDFRTPEGAFPKQKPAGWWELCTIWNSPNWGYVRKNEDSYRSTASFLTTLAQVRAWDGNLLINVGPRADGSMPKPYWDGAAELAAWMSHSGPSIFGARGGPWPEACQFPVTRRAGISYIHLPPEWKEEQVSLAVKTPPASASLLRTGAKLEVQHSAGLVRIRVPAPLRTSLDDVVAVAAGTE